MVDRKIGQVVLCLAKGHYQSDDGDSGTQLTTTDDAFFWPLTPESAVDDAQLTWPLFDCKNPFEQKLTCIMHSKV